MVDCVAVCGDSFGVGSGLKPEIAYEKFFGGLVAAELNLPLKVYARSGCCNYTIYLQVKKIIEQKHHNIHNPLVIITLTNHNRLFMPIGNTENSDERPDLSMVDYRSYDPYNVRTSPVLRPLPFQLSGFPQFCTETLSNIDLSIVGKLPGSRRTLSLVHDKINSIKSYIVDLYHSGYKNDQDTGLVALMHLTLKKEEIPHLIMGHGLARFNFIDYKNFAQNDWGGLVKLYPDDLGTQHCNERGHEIVYNNIIQKCRDLVK